MLVSSFIKKYMQERRHKIETLSTMFIAITYGLIFSKMDSTGLQDSAENDLTPSCSRNCSGRRPVILQHNLKECGSSGWKIQLLLSITSERQGNNWLCVLSTLDLASSLCLMLFLMEEGEVNTLLWIIWTLWVLIDKCNIYEVYRFALRERLHCVCWQALSALLACWAGR